MVKRMVAVAALAVAFAVVVPAVTPHSWWAAVLEACPAGKHEVRVRQCRGWLWWQRCWYKTICVNNYGPDNPGPSGIPSGAGHGGGPAGTVDGCKASDCV